MSRILVVEDEPDIAEMLGIILASEGFEIDLVKHGEEVMKAFSSHPPDLVLLDLMLPGIDGIEVCRRLRSISAVPIIMLTAKSEPEDVVLGLDAGADDYIIKPPRRPELIARVRACLRRVEPAQTALLRIGDLSIDVQGHQVSREGEAIGLTPLEFDLLNTIARVPGKVFTRDELLETVWGYRHTADTRLVNVHVQRLRAKIERDPDQPEILVTVRGIGYKAGTTH
ncbi:MAG TPA: MtrAB system response regulator MtrA [Candidatus Nanopelagicaceae bacterium]|nr:MtrAB system response regulator MtrA [Candidatus Nanopelagicaceae bacterium]